jgi:hypothetical protein
MPKRVSNVSPEAVLAAGSLINVPVSIKQARAVSARIAAYDTDELPHLGLHAWRIPAPDSWLTSASLIAGEIEVHYRYIPDEPFDLADPLVGLDVIVCDAGGVVLSHQDYGLFTDA